MKPKFHGSDPCFFVGVVEENDDSKCPDGLTLGRCQVRLFGIHSEKLVIDYSQGEGIPFGDTPWAMPIFPVTEGAMHGIGSSQRLMRGTWVLVMSLDGISSQEFFILGAYPGLAPEVDLTKGFRDPKEEYPRKAFIGEPDVNRLARVEKINKTLVQTKNNDRDLQVSIANTSGKWDQPESPYNAKYPYNQCKETESGHVIEYDDTPGEERIHFWHKNGSFIEIDKDGNIVKKSQKDDYEIVVKDKYVHAKGNMYITVDGDASILTKGNSNIEVGGNSTIVNHGSVNHSVGGDYNISVDGEFKVTASDATITPCPCK